VLREAIADPTAHPHLLVRISGYCAYFNDLSPEMKQELLDRCLHHCQ
jgi:pyruvate-formate lyase